jgi:hypothetical protein
MVMVSGAIIAKIMSAGGRDHKGGDRGAKEQVPEHKLLLFNAPPGVLNDRPGP